MPGDLTDDGAGPSDRPARDGGSGTERAGATFAQRRSAVVDHVAGPALVTASALLIAGQLFAAYRLVWPAVPGQFQPDVISMKIGFLVASPIATPTPISLASLPVLVLGGLLHLRSGNRVSIEAAWRRAGSVVALTVAVIGVLVLVGAAAWALITRGTVGSDTQYSGALTVDPVVVFLQRGSDGLAAAVLAGLAGWLLWKWSPPTPSDSLTQAATFTGKGTDEVDEFSPATPPPAPTSPPTPGSTSDPHAVVDPTLFSRPGSGARGSGRAP